MDFYYVDLIDVEVFDVYECFIMDCMCGDVIFYVLGDSVEVVWQFVDLILEVWVNNESKFFGYFAGIWGFKEVEYLFENGIYWCNFCKDFIEIGEFCELQ